MRVWRQRQMRAAAGPVRDHGDMVTHLPCAGWGVPCPAGRCPCRNTTGRTLLSEIGVTQSLFAPQCRHHPASVLHSESFMRRPAWLLPLFCSSSGRAIPAVAPSTAGYVISPFLPEGHTRFAQAGQGAAPHMRSCLAA